MNVRNILNNILDPNYYATKHVSKIASSTAGTAAPQSQKLATLPPVEGKGRLSNGMVSGPQYDENGIAFTFGANLNLYPV